MTKKKLKMEEVKKDVLNLNGQLASFRWKNRYKTVIGEGSLEAEMMFIGEAPGEKEAESGRPFVGAAGKILDELLVENSIKRKNVYITSVIKDRPPGNRNPKVSEISLYEPFLWRQMEIIKPKKIVALGRFAGHSLAKFFNVSGKLIPGKIYLVNSGWGKVKVVFIYHPAAIFYNRSLKEKLESDFKKIVKA